MIYVRYRKYCDIVRKDAKSLHLIRTNTLLSGLFSGNNTQNTIIMELNTTHYNMLKGQGINISQYN